MDVLFGCIKGRRHPSFEGFHRDGAWASIDESWQQLSMSDPAIAEAETAAAAAGAAANNIVVDPNCSSAVIGEPSTNGGGGGRRSPPESPQTGIQSMKQRLSSSVSRSKHRGSSGKCGSKSSRACGSSSSQTSLFRFRRQSSTSSASSPASPLSTSGASNVKPVCFVAPFTPEIAPSQKKTNNNAIERKSAAGDSAFAPTTFAKTSPLAIVTPVSEMERTLLTTPLMPDGIMTPPPTPASDINVFVDDYHDRKTPSKFQYPVGDGPVAKLSTPPVKEQNNNSMSKENKREERDNIANSNAKANNIVKANSTAHVNSGDKIKNTKGPNLVILSAPNSQQNGDVVGTNDGGGFQPPVEWLASFPVSSYTTLAQDQKMSAISSSPALLNSNKRNMASASSGGFGNLFSNAADIKGKASQQEQQKNQQHGVHNVSNLGKIVERYAKMNEAWLEQQRREQQQHQQFHLQQQQQFQQQQQQMAKRFFPHSQFFHQQQHLHLHQQQQQQQHRGGVFKLSAPSKFLVNPFQNLSLSPSDSLAIAGMSRFRTDAEAFAPFQFLAVLGKGNFGKVILCRDQRRADRRLCAIKVLKKKEIVKKREDVHTMTEVSVLRHLRHPFLVECYAAFQTNTRLCLVLEYAVGGELYYQLFKKRRFSEEQTRFYVAEIVLAVGFLHANDFIYRDLKLENLLLDASGHIKITDFGLCKDLRAWKNDQFAAAASASSSSSSSSSSPSSAHRRRNTTRKDMTFCGTPEYLAPEMLQVPGAFNGVSRVNGGAACGLIYGKEVDWWALGIIIYEMMLGKLPFRTKTGDYDQLFHSICHRDITLPDSLDGDVRLLLDGLLQKNPLLRLGHSNRNGRDFLDICESRWFSGVDWDAVYEKRFATPPFIPRVDNEEDTQHFSQEFLDLPTELTPTTSFNSVGGGGGGGGGSGSGRGFRGRGGSGMEENNAGQFFDDLFRGFSFTRS